MRSRLNPWAPLTLALACASCAVDDPVASQLLFNELGATGADFAELYNAGATPLDVSGYAVTDSRGDGLPKLSRAARFPAGTVVPSHGYLVVAFEGECPAASAAYVCVRGAGGGGISQTRGENVHLLDPELQVIATAAYPRAAAPSGWTWGRLPDGAGAYVATRRTPGTANTE